MSLFNAIVVVELPPLRPSDATASSAAPSPATPGGNSPASGTTSSTPNISSATTPKFILVLPHGDPSKLPRDVSHFCFPDISQLARTPYAYEHTAEEYTFTLTSRDSPRIYGYCRRYRVGSAVVGNRLDLSPFTSANADKESASTCTYQCICILSEKYVT
jgi:hypothetical protein